MGAGLAWSRMREIAQSGNTACSGSIDCVVLSCFAHEVQFLAAIVGQAHIRLHRCETLRDADFFLLATGGTVLLTDTRFLDGCWQDALRLMEQTYPLVPTLLFADVTDREAITTAKGEGVFEVLMRRGSLDRFREVIAAAHEVATERRLWAAERQAERPHGTTRATRYPYLVENW